MIQKLCFQTQEKITDHDGEVVQGAFLHPAGVHHGVQVEGTLGPALPQVPRHLAQLRAGLTLVLITITIAKTFEKYFIFFVLLISVLYLELSQETLHEFKGFDKTGQNIVTETKIAIMNMKIFIDNLNPT